MEIYIVITEDHHDDTRIELFRNMESAINNAKCMAMASCSHIEDYTEHNSPLEGVLFFAEYSCEGDSVMVKVGELN